MEITIADSAENATLKLHLMNRKLVFIFRYISFILMAFSLIFLVSGFFSGYTNHTSFNGKHFYTDYHLGTGLGIGCLATAAYLELYLYKLRKGTRKFKFSIATYFFSENGIKMTSETMDAFIHWNAVKEITVQKRSILINTNDYSCPTLIFQKEQFSKAQLIWLRSKITKK